MATPAGVTAAVLPGDLDFSAGGMDVANLVGAFVKSIDNNGMAIIQDVNGNQQSLQIGSATGSAEDLVTTPVTLPRLARGALGSVNDVTLLDGGMDYATPPTVGFLGGGGTGAAARAILTDGVVTRLLMTALGSGYTSPPAVSITRVDGTGATAEVTAFDGLGTVTITNGGSGYAPSPSPQIDFTGGGETTVARAAGIVDPDTGEITGLQFGGFGAGYTAESTAVIVSGGGTGSGFAATADYGGLSEVTVTNRGSGYYAVPTVALSGGGGTGGRLIASVRNGGVHRVYAGDRGSRYTSAPQLAVTGGAIGAGAAATAMLSPTNWVQVLTAAQWMSKGQLYILMSNEGATTIGLINWIVPTYFLQNQIAAQTSPVDLYRSSQNTVGTAGYTDASGISNSFFTFEGSFNPVYFYLAKDADNNLWAGYYHSSSPNTYRILRIGAA